MYSQRFIYVVVGQIETTSYTKFTKSTVYNTSYTCLQQRYQRSTCRFSANIVQNSLSLSSFNACIETASPLSSIYCDYICGSPLPTPKPADVCNNVQISPEQGASKIGKILTDGKVVSEI